MPSRIAFTLILTSYVAHASELVEAEPPGINLQFYAEIHASMGYGHDGDGCVTAEADIQSNPAIQHTYFDYLANSLAQTNPAFQNPDPRPNFTFVGLFGENPPTEMDVQQEQDGSFECFTEPLPAGPCPNGTIACPSVFGWWGEFDTAFTSVLGMFYPNTTLLGVAEDKSEIWQWEWVNPTLMPNGTYINVTRNYTYTLQAADNSHGGLISNRTLLRYQWTQSIPLEPALPVHRDCFIFDFRTNYVSGPISPSQWLPPPNTTCTPRTR